MTKIRKVISSYPKTFWIANSMELFERWAWYGMFMVLALYLTGSTDTGALGFSQAQKGLMMGIGTFIVYFFPILTGSFADRFGFKRALLIAYLLLMSGYFLIYQSKSYPIVFMAYIYIALGAALFKPIITATITKTTNDKTASIGFGIFYMIVNIGGFVGPFVASKLRAFDWKYVFYMSSAAIAFNIVLLLLFYHEPDRQKSTEPVADAIKRALRNVVEAIKDVKLAIFIIIMIGFWTVFNQLYYTLPVFIEQWFDTRPLYQTLASISPALADTFGTNEGIIAPEMLTNLDAGLIVVFQVLISSLIMRWKALNVIMTGILINAIGICLSFITNNSYFLIIGITVFSFGEMIGSPKFTEYIGRIAPKGKEGLYMGTSYLPYAAGHFLAGIISGSVYQRLSDKISLLRIDIAARGLEVKQITDSFTQTDFINDSAKQLNMTNEQLTTYLWQNYNPSKIWLVFMVIGLVTAAALIVYNRWIANQLKTEN